MQKLVGREKEQERLKDALESPRAELVAVYGRRRVGKTYLIDHVYADRMRFRLVGRSDGALRENLNNFAQALGKATRSAVALQPPTNWPEAFDQLKRALGRMRSSKKIVVFFDEFPWLDTRRSGFLASFEHFWNDWAAGRSHLVCVLCGSAAAWMIRNVVSQKGGLYNRVTRRIHLEPFTLAEVEAYLQMLESPMPRPQIVELYMSLGGVPFYYNTIKHHQSAPQAIQAICFGESAELAEEFQHLFRALFDNHRRHLKIIETLGKTHQGMTRRDLLCKTGMNSGGWLTETLEELESAGFIASYVPFGKKTNEALYRVIDEFALFFLRWMKSKKGKTKWKGLDWAGVRGTPAWQAWAGYAFENVCWKHIYSIKRALQIGAVQTHESPWRTSGREGPGAQIDLLIQRRDDVINVCEMKYTQTPFVITAACKKELIRKLDVFRRETKLPARFALHLTVISPYGVEPNRHVKELAPTVLDLNALF